MQSTNESKLSLLSCYSTTGPIAPPGRLLVPEVLEEVLRQIWTAVQKMKDTMPLMQVSGESQDFSNLGEAYPHKEALSLICWQLEWYAIQLHLVQGGCGGSVKTAGTRAEGASIIHHRLAA